jgi:transposase
MLREPGPQQQVLEIVTLESLVPEDHLLRNIDRYVDFEFIREEVKHLYCTDNGRPALDPVMLFKMLFIGYLFGVRSERQLMREIQVNVAYRWFLRLGLTDRVPDASTLSQNRRRRFAQSAVYQRIFDRIVLQAIRQGFVEGKVIYTDSTHLKASANKHKFTEQQAHRSTVDYLDALEKAVNADRQAHGKKPFKVKPAEPDSKSIKKSTTDPDRGNMVREGKPKGFFYLDHRSVDGQCNIITDCYVTPASLHDSVPYLSRLDRQRARFGFKVQAVGLDAGYFTAGICKGLEDRGIYGVIGYRRPTHRPGYFRKRDYTYDPEQDHYVCPAKQLLKYRTTNRQGYREYISDPQHCQSCPLRGQCTQSANRTKVVTRHVWEASKERINQHRLTPVGKAIYRRRKETIERSFADAKQLHGHRYARMRGLKKAQEQCLLAAACQNMKKMALLMAQKNKPSTATLLRLLSIVGLYKAFHRLSPCFNRGATRKAGLIYAAI